MKKASAILLVLTLLISGMMMEAQVLKLDASKSSIVWTGKKVTGSHNGKINLLSGSLNQSGKNYIGGEFVADMKSITCDDLTDAETNAKLVGHLKSDDFFGVETYPTAKLVINSGKPKGVNQVEFKGDLTIKGITQPVTLDATITPDVKGAKFTGKLTVDRSKFNVKYGSGSFFDNLGDNMIYDPFDLDFNAYLTK
jgi:polyisoprenoid-binding protein YceI